ncbi:hypothetical protein GYMLUDRAFT_382267 [Collybiopsis luxurians FD-317 M1]|nr:hypothetical protein GYMLUDRAFT_382267 [Collybiopsis luxurians FD-317 M1]
MTERLKSPVPLVGSAMNINVVPTPPITIASGFEDLWATALMDYKEQTGRDFHPDQIAQFSACRSVDDVVTILGIQSKGLEAFRKKGKNVRDVLKPFVRLVQLFNDTVGEAAAAVNVPGGKAVFVAFGALLEVHLLLQVSNSELFSNLLCRQPKV